MLCLKVPNVVYEKGNIGSSIHTIKNDIAIRACTLLQENITLLRKHVPCKPFFFALHALF